MLETHIVRELLIADSDGRAGPAHLSAASGLVRVVNRLYVVADDEHHLAMFDLSNRKPGKRIPMFEGDLPSRHKARKAAKPDCEALLMLPAFGEHANGALLAMGSGSRPSRYRGALLALDAAGNIQGPVRTLDLTALLAPLNDHFPDLNIEGAFIQGDLLCLLQRGNGGSGINARIELSWPALQRWLEARGPAPEPESITRYELGSIDGIALSFTDGVALPTGDWLFSAAAEDTSDTYSDGLCAGSVIGVVDAGGTIRAMERLSLNCKVEGIAAEPMGETTTLLLVTDADDRSQPALLLSTELRL